MKLKWPSRKKSRKLKKPKNPKKQENQERRKQGKKEKAGNPAKSVPELAEELGMFPSDVEDVLKELQEKGAVECYMHEGILYAVFKDDVDLTMQTIKDTNESMYA